MNIQMLEGLLGASSNIKMKQALGYTGGDVRRRPSSTRSSTPRMAPAV